MARHHHNHSQLPERDHIQARNGLHNEPLPLGQKLCAPPGIDAPIRLGSSGHGSMAISSDLPSSSHVAPYPGHQAGNPRTSHASHIHCASAGSSGGYLPYDAQYEPSLSYPHRSEEGFAPVSSQVDNRRVTLKRKNPIIHPMDGISAGGYYAGSSSNSQYTNYMQPNPAPQPESYNPQVPLSIGSSNWNYQSFVNQEVSERNVRGRHDCSGISLEPRPASAYTSNSIQLPPFHSNASAPLNTPVGWNQAPLSVPPRTVPSGTTGSTSVALRDRPYYPAPQNNHLSAPVPTLHGPSDSALFTNGGYAPRPVHSDAVTSYSHPASATSSSSRAASSVAAMLSHAPATSAATSTSMRIGQPFPVRAAASSRHSRHVSIGHGSSGRSRRARNYYYGFHPLMIEAERFMTLDQLVFYESREAVDPHWDMRLDIDDMSYEQLLALEEWMGDVNMGLASEKISGCVTELVCCSSNHTQNGQDDGSCVICLEEYKDKDSLGRLECGHDFHADCIKKWLQVKNSCPVCKTAADEDTKGRK